MSGTRQLLQLCVQPLHFIKQVQRQCNACQVNAKVLLQALCRSNPVQADT